MSAYAYSKHIIHTHTHTEADLIGIAGVLEEHRVQHDQRAEAVHAFLAVSA